MASSVVIMARDLELLDECVVCLDWLDGEVFLVGDFLASMVEDELAGGGFAFPSVDFWPGEDESVKGVCLARGERDDMFAIKIGEICWLVSLTGERAGPIHVYSNSALTDETAIDGQVRGKFFEMLDCFFEVIEAAPKFGLDLLGGLS